MRDPVESFEQAVKIWGLTKPGKTQTFISTRIIFRPNSKQRRHETSRKESQIHK